MLTPRFCFSVHLSGPFRWRFSPFALGRCGFPTWIRARSWTSFNRVLRSRGHLEGSGHFFWILLFFFEGVEIEGLKLVGFTMVLLLRLFFVMVSCSKRVWTYWKCFTFIFEVKISERPLYGHFFWGGLLLFVWMFETLTCWVCFRKEADILWNWRCRNVL